MQDKTDPKDFNWESDAEMALIFGEEIIMDIGIPFRFVKAYKYKNGIYFSKNDEQDIRSYFAETPDDFYDFKARIESEGLIDA